MTGLVTRRPTGMPSWPILLLAGPEKSGKSWACAEASGSDLVGRTLWVPIGEDDPDEYSLIPGADFEIAQHNGTYRGILDTLDACSAEPTVVDGRPNLLIVDSGSRLWDLLCSMAQAEADARARRKAREQKRPEPTGEVDISMDLWNIAKDRWGHVIDVLRNHQGPSIITARLEEVTVVEHGKPTTTKSLKVKAEKSLPHDAGAIVEMPRRGEAWLCGVRSVRLQLPQRTKIKGEFRVDRLWRDLGLHEVQVGQRRYSHVRWDPDGDGPAEQPQQPQEPRDRPQRAQQPTRQSRPQPPRQHRPHEEAPDGALVGFLAAAAKAEDPAVLERMSKGLRPRELAKDATAAIRAEVRAVTDTAGLTQAGEPITVGHWIAACQDYHAAQGRTVFAAYEAEQEASKGRAAA